MHAIAFAVAILLTIVLQTTAEVTETDLDTRQESCEPESKWKEDCNTCYCMPNGLAACTRRGCVTTQRMGHPKKECIPNTTWKEDCNTCFCTLKGWAACTRMGCLKTKRATNRKDCVPGTSWKAECNNCVCTENGRAVCTLRACPPSHI